MYMCLDTLIDMLHVKLYVENIHFASESRSKL